MCNRTSEVRKKVRRQTVMVATFLIAMLAAVTIFAAVNSAQQHIAPTEKILKTDDQDLRGQPFYPPIPSGYPSIPPVPSGYPSVIPSGYPSIFPSPSPSASPSASPSP